MSPARLIPPLIPLALLAACAPTYADVDPETMDARYCPWETREWNAYVNAMPGPGNSGPTLIVTGEANVPAGWRAVMVPGPTDRMQPPGQRFALTLEPDEGAAGGWQDVRGEIRPALKGYSSVIIGCAGDMVARVDEIEKVY